MMRQRNGTLVSLAHEGQQAAYEQTSADGFKTHVAGQQRAGALAELSADAVLDLAADRGSDPGICGCVRATADGGGDEAPDCRQSGSSSPPPSAVERTHPQIPGSLPRSAARSSTASAESSASAPARCC